MTSGKKPGVALTVVLFVLLVAYPLSFGPACWIVSRLESDRAGCVSSGVRSGGRPDMLVRGSRDGRWIGSNS